MCLRRILSFTVRRVGHVGVFFYFEDVYDSGGKNCQVLSYVLLFVLLDYYRQRY